MSKTSGVATASKEGVILTDPDCLPATVSPTENPITDIVRVTYEGGFFVPGLAEASHVSWLIDTGCTSTILSSRVWSQMDEEERPDLLPYSGHLMSADETPIKVQGRAIFHITLGEVQVQHSAIVADVMNDGLLGLDFMREHKMVVNFSTLEITMEGKKVVSHCNIGTDRACRVVAIENTTLPSRSRTVLAASTTKPLVAGNWLVEPTNKTPGDLPVLLAKTLSSGCGNTVMVELINPTENDVYLYKHTRLGLVSRGLNFHYDITV